MLKRRTHRRKSHCVAELEVQQLEQRALLAATMDVYPGDSIQEAVDNAPNEATIVIHEGDYYQHVEISEKSLKLVGKGNVNILGSENGRDEFVGGSYDGIYVEDAEWFTLRNVGVGEHGDDGIEIVNVGRVTLYKVDSWGNGFGQSDGDGEGIQLDNVGKALLYKVGAYDNIDDGIDADTTGKFVGRKLDVAGNGGDGLDIDTAETVSIVNGVFDDNGEHGVDVDEVADADFMKIWADDNSDDGFNIDEAKKFSLRQGWFYGNSEDGVDINSMGFALLKGVRANENGDDGLDIDGANKAYVKYGWFNDNGGDEEGSAHGIDADEVSKILHVFRVEASGNSGDGVNLDNGEGEGSSGLGRAVIRGSKFLGNGDDGGQISYVDSVFVKGVKADENSDDGFNIMAANDVDVSYSKFRDNGDDGLELSWVDDFWYKKVKAYGNGDEDIVWHSDDVT